MLCLHVWPNVCVCVWHQQSLCKWLIQVFDFKANGDSSGGWAGGKMLHLPPSSSLGLCSDLHFLVWYFFFISYTYSFFSSFLGFLFFFFFFFCHWFCLIISSKRKKKAFHIPKCLELFLRRVCHSNVMLRVQLGGSGLGPLPTFVLLTQLHGSLPPFWRGVVAYGWPLGSGHLALTCEPPGRPARVGPTVTPHAVTLDWGCHACADVSCQVWQGFLQHACLLASSPVGLYSDRAPDSALDAD